MTQQRKENGTLYDAAALGELLVDFTQHNVSSAGNLTFEANPGGAPCNALSMLAHLGKKTVFIGKVGDDAFGHDLVSDIAEQGIGTEGIVYDKKIPTTLALVHKLPDGDRDFSFYRNPGADVMLKPEEVNTDLIKKSRLFHFGSLSLTDAPARYATQLAVLEAKHAGITVSFDPNLREPLWPSLDEAKEQIAWGMKQCDVLKISDNEIQWFTGIYDFDKAAEYIRENYKNIRLICLTKGPDGSAAYYGGRKVEAGAFEMDDTIETTGAGDTFCGCMLSFILENGLEDLSEKDIEKMLIFANAAAAIVTTRKGALKMMPYRNEIEELIAERV